jgi:hypothetical protein
MYSDDLSRTSEEFDFKRIKPLGIFTERADSINLQIKIAFKGNGFNEFQDERIVQCIIQLEAISA